MKRPAAEPAGTSPALKRPAAAEPAAPIADLKPPADAVPAAPVLKRPAAAEPAAPFAGTALPTEQELLHEAAYMCIDPVAKTKPEPAKMVQDVPAQHSHVAIEIPGWAQHHPGVFFH